MRPLHPVLLLAALALSVGALEAQERETPDCDAYRAMALKAQLEVERALAGARPEMERALREAGRAAERAMREARPEVERALRQARPEIERALREAHREALRRDRQLLDERPKGTVDI